METKNSIPSMPYCPNFINMDLMDIINYPSFKYINEIGELLFKDEYHLKHTYLHTDIILLQTNSTTYMNKSNQSQAIKTSGYQQKTLKPLGFSQNFSPLQNLNFIMKRNWC